MTLAAISLRKLGKSFGAKRALAGIDLELDGADLVGVDGPDGAGKTTLLRALAGLLEIEAEQASVLGVDLRGDVRALKQRVGYVPQAFSLPRDLSVLENLRFTGRLHQLDEAVFAERSGALLARTGLAPFADRPAAKLSGGMKQKLAISCALLSDPALLLLDEPTAGVDVVARDEIWSMLRERRGRSLILISTSYLEEVEACDRLLYLDDGRVVAAGTPSELRAGVALELYRAWGDEPRAIAAAARRLPYVGEARATGRYARIEVPRARTPGAARVLADLVALPAVVQLAEQAPLDMEATLLALARPSAPGVGANA
ncbi:MAG: ABC transporter ATP-binding protein [Deltaproteobacteria bacterium]|nr:ABC transporter ATP-binding protein [Deltaproteobacteria bacterium]